MNFRLLSEALIKYIMGVIIVGILVFLPSGTIKFINGWLLMGVVMIPIFIAGLVMFIKNPQLLAKRLDGKEKQKEQGIVVKLSGLMFITVFVLAGMGYRFEWYILPMWVSVMASIIYLCGYLLYAEVLRENTYLSRTIEISENQKVVDTGLYSVVRHPMYSATLLIFLMMPLILGSVYGFGIFMLYPFLIAKRIKYEENLLEKELVGYSEYKNKIRYRLIPYIW